MSIEKEILASKDHFEGLIRDQLKRIKRIKSQGDWIDYSSLKKIRIGLLGGDGIGPQITEDAKRVLSELLQDDIANNSVEFINIEGLTIENRAKHLKAIPDDVLEEIKSCHVTLKGPTTTPEKGDNWPNIESANVGMRKELDLFANVRPVKVPEENIDWVFFRENTEDSYALGSQGIEIDNELAMDFKVITSIGSQRIIEAAFNHARNTGRKRVSVVTKANILKKTDGKFLEEAEKVASQFPEIEWDSWYIDIMTANLLHTRRSEFEVFVMPNLYGDILTDEAAQIQGGVGTAGSANLGKQHAMFEAIHGSAPRMLKEGRAQFANPSSMIKAGAMLLEHIGYTKLAQKLDKALSICGQYEKKLQITGRDNGVTGEEYGKYVLNTVRDKNIDEKYEKYAKETQ
tara:strand:+ start:1768 stop:2973 length:1206 start_codon:yes stop_codon:yes gene_type:complete